MEDMEVIYRAHARTVYKFLLSQCHDDALAEELTQETFYQAVRSSDRFDGGSKHLFYQHLRRQKREEPLPEEEGILEPLPSAEAEALGRAGQLDLLRRVHDLPEPGREVVYLRVFGSLSFREIGEVLGRTETWARVTFYRCKEHLKTGGEYHEK